MRTQNNLYQSRIAYRKYSTAIAVSLGMMKTTDQDAEVGPQPDDIEVVLRASRALVGVAARSLAPVEDVVSAMQWRLLVVVSGHGSSRFA
jgi:hypothetical protein